MGRDDRFVVVMAGGQGTRFWPRSRQRLPKQLLPIAGARTMLQETVRRIRPLCGPARTLVITGEGHAAAVRRQLPTVPRGNVVAEPMGRNTAPCIALAAELIAAQAPDAAMIVLPADHVIADVAAFHACVRRALAVARAHDCLVTLGVTPTHAETGYGYIEVGAPIDGAGAPRAHWARAFHEKPDGATAERYASSGRHFWNSGMFVWRVDVIRAAMAQHLPAVAAALAPLRRARGARGRATAMRRAYRALPTVSIDTGVMERAARVAVVEADIGWSDVGSWAAMPALWGTDAAGNATRGPVIGLDTKRTIAFSSGRPLALLGVEDLIVVDAGDATLICRRDRAQDVRLVVAELKRRGLRRLL